MGDSISAAYGMAEEDGWVALLNEKLRGDNSKVFLTNASMSGETTKGALVRFPHILERIKPSVVILELGGNDGLRGWPTEAIQENLLQMTRMAQESGSVVIILGMELPPNYGPKYTDAFRSLFAAVANETGSILVPFFLDGVATVDELMFDDGIHPNVEAQPRLVDVVVPVLQEAISRYSSGAAAKRT